MEAIASFVLQGQGGGTRHDYHYQNHGHQNYADPDERVMGHIKVEALAFEGRLDPWAFIKWLRDIDHFFEWSNLSKNRRIQFAKTKLRGSAQLSRRE